jgi:hypothetical protein
MATLAVATPAQSETPDEPSAKAQAVLETHCARCHQAGRLENPPAKGSLGNILDLSRLVEREDLVLPSDPDASRIYQILLARHRPQSVFYGPLPGPGPAEIGAVRDWLAALPPRPSQCAGKAPVSKAAIEQTIAAWRKAFETDRAEPLRFISLANLHNLCRSDATIAAYRDAVATLLRRLTLRASVELDTVGDASVLLAFRPSDFGLTPEAWDLRAGTGDDLPGVVTAEGLAARAMAASAPAAGASASGIASALAAPAENLIDGLDPIDALASEFRRTVSAERAAVELHLDPADLRRQLEALGGGDRSLGKRLIQSGLPRDEWEPLRARLAGRPQKPAHGAAPSGSSTALRLALWSNAAAYTAGDLLTVFARPSADCNLTVIAIEANGQATVLFPNDWTTDNRVSGGSLLQIPASQSSFQFRLDKPGRHGVVGICNATARRPQGIGHDFERQRFTVLGDWRTFLLETVEREAAYQKSQEDLRRFRTGAGGAETLEEQLPLGTEDEARAGFSVVVQP